MKRDLTDNRAVWMRNQAALRMVVPYRRAVLNVFKQYSAFILDQIAAGVTPDMQQLSVKMQRALVKAQTPLASNMFAAGMKLAGHEIQPQKSAIPELSELFPGLEFGLTAREFQDVEAHLLRVAGKQTKAYANRIAKMLDRARKFIMQDEEGFVRGQTNRETAKKLVALLGKAIPAYDFQHCLTIALTETSWAANHGAMERYSQAGYTTYRWFATQDDVLCEFCAELDGTIWKAGSSPTGGGSVEGLAGGTYTPADAGDIPPLHPRCRCVALAVLDEQSLVDAREGREQVQAEFKRRLEEGEIAAQEARRAQALSRRNS
jgi:hypothetical protein